MYKLTIDPRTVHKIDENKSIPLVPDNIDCQAYLKWLEEGNQPLPADEAQPSA